MFLLFFTNIALAHSGSPHRIRHYIKWVLATDVSEITYTIDLPHQTGDAENTPQIIRELSSGLSLSSPTTEYTLQLTSNRVTPLQRGLRITLHLRAGHTSDELILSNGNFIESPATSTVVLLVSPRLEVEDSSLFVYHRGVVVRTESGRPQARSSARKTSVRTHLRGSLDQLHRLLQGRFFPEEITAETISYTHNITGIWGLFTPLLGGLAPINRADKRQWAGAATVAFLELWVRPDAYASAFLFIALLAALTLYRRPKNSVIVLTALAASLDLYGAGLATLVVSGILGQQGFRPHRSSIIILSFLIGLQSVRVWLS